MNRFFRIRYIILLAVVLRFYNITAPLIGIHSWRQTDTAAMARNYYENDMNFLYPQVDWGGSTSGYVECEFPLYSYLTAVLYNIFGFTEIWGRLLSLIFSIIGIYYLYRLVCDIIDVRTALWSSLFTSILPLNVFFGRAFMPEPAMLACSVAGLYYFYRWTVNCRIRSLLLSAGFVTLACLLKLPALYLGIPIFFLAWQKYTKRIFIRFELWAYALLVLSCVCLWYYHAHQILLNGGLTFGIWEYGSDKWGNWELLSTFKFWNGIIFQSLAEKHFTWAGFVVFVTGLFLSRKSGKEFLFDFWLLAVAVYFVIVARGNYVHSYYQLPFMLPGVVYLGKVYSRFFTGPNVNNPVSIVLAVCLIGIIILGGWRYQEYMKYENPETSQEFRLAGEIKTLTESGSLLVVLDGKDPTILYLSHRKGWHPAPGELNNDYLEQRKKNGARYFVGLNKLVSAYLPQQLDPLLSSYGTVYKNEDMFIVDLRKTVGPNFLK